MYFLYNNFQGTGIGHHLKRKHLDFLPFFTQTKFQSRFPVKCNRFWSITRLHISLLLWFRVTSRMSKMARYPYEHKPIKNKLTKSFCTECLVLLQGMEDDLAPPEARQGRVPEPYWRTSEVQFMLALCMISDIEYTFRELKSRARDLRSKVSALFTFGPNMDPNRTWACIPLINSSGMLTSHTAGMNSATIPRSLFLGDLGHITVLSRVFMMLSMISL